MQNIAFLGKKGSGKTTAANSLQMVYGHKPISFAHPLKLEVFERLLGMRFFNSLVFHAETVSIFSELDLEIEDFPLPPKLETSQEKVKWINANKIYLRNFLQKLGTDYYREKNLNYWIDKLLEEAKDRLVAIDDCRFENEGIALLEKGYRLIYIYTSRIKDDDPHPSENLEWLSKYPYHSICNDGSLMDFHNAVIKAAS